jgi:hypothetical protein
MMHYFSPRRFTFWIRGDITTKKHDILRYGPTYAVESYDGATGPLDDHWHWPGHLFSTDPGVGETPSRGSIGGNRVDSAVKSQRRSEEELETRPRTAEVAD